MPRAFLPCSTSRASCAHRLRHHRRAADGADPSPHFRAVGAREARDLRFAKQPMSEREDLATIVVGLPKPGLHADKFLGLTTRLPRQIWIALPRDSRASWQPRLTHRAISWSWCGWRVMPMLRALMSTNATAPACGFTVPQERWRSCDNHCNQIGLHVPARR